MADLALALTAHLGAFTLDVTLRVERGPIALVGPNGAGKTTLLRAIAGAIPSTRGTVDVRGRSLANLPPEARGVGYLPQGGALFEHLTVAGNVGYGVRADRDARVAALLRGVDAAHLADRRPRELSGGERQRVALARALGPDPALLLLDEPTASLDVAVRPRIRALVGALLRDRVAIVVTHDARDLLAWDPLVVLIEGGRVTTTGTVAALRGSGHPFLAELLATPSAAPSSPAPAPRA